MDVAICESYSKLFHGDKVQNSVMNRIMLTTVPRTALRYKPEVCGFDSRWSHRNSFIDINLSAVLWPWGRQLLTEKSTTNIFWGVKAAGACGWTYHLNPLNPELNPIWYLLALLAHHFLHVSRIRVKSLTLRLLMSYIHGAPILAVSRSHTTTQHSR